MGTKKRIGRYRLYITRAGQYIGMGRSFMIIVIFLAAIEIKLAWYWYLLIIPITIFGYLIIGYWDTKSGIRKAESLSIQEQQPYTMESYRMIKEIYDVLINKQKNKLDENNNSMQN